MFCGKLFIACQPRFQTQFGAHLEKGSSYNRNAKEARRHMLEHITDAQALMGSAK